MKISKSFAEKIKALGYEYSVQMAEHPGCWGKGCTHLEPELSVWRPEKPQFKSSFTNPTEDWVIQRLIENPVFNPTP